MFEQWWANQGSGTQCGPPSPSLWPTKHLSLNYSLKHEKHEHLFFFFNKEMPSLIRIVLCFVVQRQWQFILKFSCLTPSKLWPAWLLWRVQTPNVAPESKSLSLPVLELYEPSLALRPSRSDLLFCWCAESGLRMVRLCFCFMKLKYGTAYQMMWILWQTSAMLTLHTLSGGQR